MERIIIIGGGIIGSSTAYHLAMAGLAQQTTVIEPDPLYEFAATPKSTGGIRVQFSVPENIRMSQYGHEFYGNFAQLMTVDGDAPEIGLHRPGYLYLGTGEDLSNVLIENQRIQAAEGANVQLLDRHEIKSRFPSMEVEDIDVGAYSPHDAIIDPHAALMGLRKKAISLGVHYERDRVTHLEMRGTVVSKVHLEVGAPIQAEWVVNAANCWAPKFCEQIGMPVPVAPLPRNTFYFECDSELEPMPLTRHLGIAGSYRKEGRGYITGYTPYEQHAGFNWDVDYPAFDAVLWPNLAHRVKAFESIKMVRAWACHYDQNALDLNLIIGNRPGHVDNCFIACGLSGHGLQQAPAIGRALSELIIHGRYQTLDLSRFGYQRIIDNQPLADRGPIS
ncbi:MAG: FAD-binding oxidoreductase [Gammaproteobacteria bacterium]|nr:FAD-binding oxidoreductase [Gammaproteobacteria bacterium]